MNIENQDELRQTLLELHYGLLDEDEATQLRAAIQTDPEIAAQWAATLQMAGKFADAAKFQGPPSKVGQPNVSKLTVEPCPTVAAVQLSSRFRRIWRAPTILSAIAASIGWMIIGGWYIDRVPQKPLAVVRVQAEVTPSKQQGVDNEFRVLTTRLDDSVGASAVSGFPVTAASLSFSVLARNTVLFSGVARTDQRGAGKIVLPPELVIPHDAKLRVTARSTNDELSASSIDVPLEPTRCLTYLTIDRPVYRPGETLYFRSLTLTRRWFRADVDVPIHFELIDPSGAVVPGAVSEGVTDRGVGNGAFQIPSTAAGGPYTLVAKSLDGFFPEERCPLQVRLYRVPRFKKELEFRRASYGPGETVEADFLAERAEGGPLAGAKIQITAKVDDKIIHADSTTASSTGTCEISFSLPSHITAGIGQLSVVVDDGGTQETQTKTIPIQLGRVAVEFYPEGGYLVDGLRNRVYFVARNSLGQPIHIAGEIQNRSGQSFASVETTRDGMGRFEFVPQRGERYTLKVTTPMDVTNAPKLPAVVKDLPVIDTGSGVFELGQPITMVVSTKTTKSVVVRAVCRGQLVGEQSTQLQPGENTLSLPIREDAAGVIRVTVLDATTLPSRPLVERLVFRRQQKKLAIEVLESDSALQRSPGEPLRLTLQVRDETGQPAAAVLGVAVVDDAALSLDPVERPNLRTHFLLTSEVQKPEDLEHANFYLSDGPEAAAAIDLLLGTQGWRRFLSGSSNQPNLDFRAQLVRLLELDGNDVANLNQTYDNSRGREHQWIRYRAAVTSAWNRLLMQAQLLMASVLILWLVAILLRLSAQKRVGVTIWLLVASTSLFIYGCGTSTPTSVVESTLSAPRSDAARPLDKQDMAASAVDRPAEIGDAGQPPAQTELDPNSTEAVSAVNRFLSRFVDDRSARSPDPSSSGATADMSTRSLTQDDLRQLLAARGLDADALADQLLDELRFPIRQYAHQHVSDDPATREDFAETLYWQPMLITDSDGRATIRFDLSDSVTTFRVSVDGHAMDGRIGTGTFGVTSRLPFQIEPTMPLEVTTGDRINLPIAIVNATDADAEVNLSLTADPALRPTGETTRLVKLPSGGRHREHMSLEVLTGSVDQHASVQIRGVGQLISDAIRRSVHITPAGYPASDSVAGRLSGTETVRVKVPNDLVEGSLAVAIRAYPSPLADVMSGVESVLREPHGCFEQASATNYPNTMALMYLRESQTANPDVSRRALGMLDRGYQKLIGFECQQRGYEWFGQDPGHEALSAFGLMQFTDMSKVMVVSEEMIHRTRLWLMGRRDGQGGFQRNPRHLHVWSVQQPIVNAYVLWAITEADVAAGQPHRAAGELAPELDQLQQTARQSNDPYLIALSAAAVMNVQRSDDGERLLQKLAELQNEDGSLQGNTTVTSSGGVSLKMETTALATIAWVKSPRFVGQAQSAARWLTTNRSGDGGFGSTQATVLALKALVAIAAHGSTQTGGGLLQVKLAGEVIGAAALPQEPSTGSTVEISELGKSVEAALDGSREVTLELVAPATVNLSYSVEVSYHRTLPRSDDGCPFELSTRLADDGTVRAGKTLGVEVRLLNRTAEGQPMTVAIIGLPGGLEPRVEQLDELQESGRFDYYELRGREVILYWRTIEPQATKLVDFDVTATIPGQYTGPASRAYLYYTAEQKRWTDPLKIEIKP